MAKTQPTTASVPAFLSKVKDPALRADCEAVSALMQQLRGAGPPTAAPRRRFKKLLPPSLPLGQNAPAVQP